MLSFQKKKSRKSTENVWEQRHITETNNWYELVIIFSTCSLTTNKFTVEFC